MKFSLIIILTIFASPGFGQSCGCNEDSSLSEFASCDTISLKNGSMIYSQFDCDYFWLTFESKAGIKSEIYSISSEMMGLDLGYYFYLEYENTFLMESPTCSGSDCPAESILYDKDSGTLLENFGIVIQFAGDSLHPYALYFKDSSYNTIVIYDLNNRKKIFAALPPGRIAKGLGKSYFDEYGSPVHAEYLFEIPVVKDGNLTMDYRYQKPHRGKKSFRDKLSVKLEY